MLVTVNRECTWKWMSRNEAFVGYPFILFTEAQDWMQCGRKLVELESKWENWLVAFIVEIVLWEIELLSVQRTGNRSGQRQGFFSSHWNFSKLFCDLREFCDFESSIKYYADEILNIYAGVSDVPTLDVICHFTFNKNTFYIDKIKQQNASSEYLRNKFASR